MVSPSKDAALNKLSEQVEHFESQIEALKRERTSLIAERNSLHQEKAALQVRVKNYEREPSVSRITDEQKDGGGYSFTATTATREQMEAAAAALKTIGELTTERDRLESISRMQLTAIQNLREEMGGVQGACKIQLQAAGRKIRCLTLGLVSCAVALVAVIAGSCLRSRNDS